MTFQTMIKIIYIKLRKLSSIHTNITYCIVAKESMERLEISILLASYPNKVQDWLVANNNLWKEDCDSIRKLQANCQGSTYLIQEIQFVLLPS